MFPKVKSHLKGRLFDSISDIQKAVTSTLNTTAKDDFYKVVQIWPGLFVCKQAGYSHGHIWTTLYKGIQKLYDGANLCVQLQGIDVEN